MKTNRPNSTSFGEREIGPAFADAFLFSSIQIVLLVSAVVLRQAAD